MESRRIRVLTAKLLAVRNVASSLRTPNLLGNRFWNVSVNLLQRRRWDNAVAVFDIRFIRIPSRIQIACDPISTRDFFNLYAVIVIDGPATHVRVSFVNSGVDRGAVFGMARPSSLRAGDHPFADAISDVGHRDKRAAAVEHANGVSSLKPPRRRILWMDADDWRARLLHLRRNVRKH